MWSTGNLQIRNAICACLGGPRKLSLYPVTVFIQPDGSAIRNIVGWKTTGRPVGNLCRNCGGYEPWTETELKILGIK